MRGVVFGGEILARWVVAGERISISLTSHVMSCGDWPGSLEYDAGLVTLTIDSEPFDQAYLGMLVVYTVECDVPPEASNASVIAIESGGETTEPVEIQDPA